MKTFAQRLLAITVALAGTGVLTASASVNDQWYRAKFGRSTPAEEARIQQEKDSTAYRVEPAGPMAAEPERWSENHFRQKYGRSTPLNEARLQEEQANSAFRAAPAGTPERDEMAERYRMKYGRALAR